MIKFDMRLNITSTVRFAKEASKEKFDIDVKQGKYIINGKSALGLFSLDLTDDITVEINATYDEALDFIHFCNKHITTSVKEIEKVK